MYTIYHNIIELENGNKMGGPMMVKTPLKDHTILAFSTYEVALEYLKSTNENDPVIINLKEYGSKYPEINSKVKHSIVLDSIDNLHRMRKLGEDFNYLDYFHSFR